MGPPGRSVKVKQLLPNDKIAEKVIFISSNVFQSSCVELYSHRISQPERFIDHLAKQDIFRSLTDEIINRSYAEQTVELRL